MPRNLTWDFVFVTLMVAGLAFLAVDVLFGDVGVDETGDLKSKKSALQAEIRTLEVERDQLEKRTRAVIGPEIDRDLLDEQMRAKLGVGRADEVLLVEPDKTGQ